MEKSVPVRVRPWAPTFELILTNPFESAREPRQVRAVGVNHVHLVHALAGLTGTMQILIDGGKHSYTFDYSLPAY